MSTEERFRDVDAIRAAIAYADRVWRIGSVNFQMDDEARDALAILADVARDVVRTD